MLEEQNELPGGCVEGSYRYTCTCGTSSSSVRGSALGSSEQTSLVQSAPSANACSLFSRQASDHLFRDTMSSCCAGSRQGHHLTEAMLAPDDQLEATRGAEAQKNHLQDTAPIIPGTAKFLLLSEEQQNKLIVTVMHFLSCLGMLIYT